MPPAPMPVGDAVPDAEYIAAPGHQNATREPGAPEKVGLTLRAGRALMRLVPVGAAAGFDD